MKCFVALLILNVVSVMAADREWAVLETSDSSYKNTKLLKIEPDGIRIMHASGAAKVPYEKLPENLIRQLGFDTAKAAQYRTDVSQQRQEQTKELLAKKVEVGQRTLATARYSDLKYGYMVVQLARVLPDGGLLCYRHQEGGSVGSVVNTLNALHRPCARVTHVESYTEFDKPLYISNV